jgi:flagellar capping protein FliD
MTWLQLLAQAAVFATILGFFITVVAFLNGRHIRIGLQRTNEMIKRMEDGLRETLREMDERHTAILAKMDGTLAKIDNTLAKMGEILAKMEENASRRHEELISIMLGKGGSG